MKNGTLLIYHLLIYDLFIAILTLVDFINSPGQDFCGPYCCVPGSEDKCLGCLDSQFACLYEGPMRSLAEDSTWGVQLLLFGKSHLNLHGQLLEAKGSKPLFIFWLQSRGWLTSAGAGGPVSHLSCGTSRLAGGGGLAGVLLARRAPVTIAGTAMA